METLFDRQSAHMKIYSFFCKATFMPIMLACSYTTVKRSKVGPLWPLCVLKALLKIIAELVIMNVITVAPTL